jgi:DNA-binding response OmpR family regulator
MTTPRILIVDDSLTVRMDLREAFEEAGLRSIDCATAAAAREAFRSTAFGVVILDVLLPDGDGISLLEEIRHDERNSHAPVILLSTEAEVRDRVRGLTRGADEYVGKPYDASFVIGRARELLATGGPERAPDARRVILRIDDSREARAGLSEELAAAGFRVVTAESGERGLRVAAEVRPDAVLLNGNLPGIDGYTVARRMKLDGNLRRTPILMFTGGAERPDDELRALDAGADAFVRNVERNGAILARLASMLRGGERADRAHDLATSSLGPQRILIIDDDPAYVDLVSTELRHDGYDVAFARSGREALELLRVQRADCVLLDLLTPDMSGVEICRCIRGVPALRDVPVIVVTAVSESSRVIESMNAGADDYVTKSSDWDVLRARVRAQLRRRQVEEENRNIHATLMRQEREAAEARAAKELSEVRAALLADLEQKNEELREADRRKDEFLGVLSHELRNPLAPILNALYILDRADPASERAERTKQVIARQVTHLKGLVDDLLDVTRISRGKIQLHRGRVELGELVRRTVEDHQPIFAARHIEVSLRGVDGVHCVNGDATRIIQVLGNLLLNAGKFTNAHGHVVVEVGREGSSAFVRVSDDGVGIDAGMLPHVFEPFRQADKTLHRSLGGLGLGLALVKGLVELHGGQAEARSDGIDRGAVFTVRFPVGEDVPLQLDAPKRAAAPSRRRRVLVIEDNLDCAETLKEVLELNGQDVAVAYDGRDGVTKARALKAELVFCDIGLPELDGYEVARQLRADPDLAPTLVALTGYARPEDQRMAFEAGFDHHLGKPLSLTQLEEFLARLPADATPR